MDEAEQESVDWVWTGAGTKALPLGKMTGLNEEGLPAGSAVA